jgi:hypothetical protein
VASDACILMAAARVPMVQHHYALLTAVESDVNMLKAVK